MAVEEAKSVMEQPSSDLFSSIGALIGFNMGGPMGALLGSAGGTLLSGGIFDEALNSGIGSLFMSGGIWRGFFFFYKKLITLLRSFFTF